MILKQAIVTPEELLKLGEGLEQQIVNLGSLEKPDLAVVLMFDSETRLGSDLEPKPIILWVKNGMSQAINLGSIHFVTDLKGKDFTLARIKQQYNINTLASQLLSSLGC